MDVEVELHGPCTWTNPMGQRHSRYLLLALSSSIFISCGIDTLASVRRSQRCTSAQSMIRWTTTMFTSADQAAVTSKRGIDHLGFAYSPNNGVACEYPAVIAASERGGKPQ